MRDCAYLKAESQVFLIKTCLCIHPPVTRSEPVLICWFFGQNAVSKILFTLFQRFLLWVRRNQCRTLKINYSLVLNSQIWAKYLAVSNRDFFWRYWSVLYSVHFKYNIVKKYEIHLHICMERVAGIGGSLNLPNWKIKTFDNNWLLINFSSLTELWN